MGCLNKINYVKHNVSNINVNNEWEIISKCDVETRIYGWKGPRVIHKLTRTKNMRREKYLPV